MLTHFPMLFSNLPLEDYRYPSHIYSMWWTR